MKFEIAKIVRVIRLSEYAAEYEGVEIKTWVNPPQRLLTEHDRLITETQALIGKAAPGGELAGLEAIADGLAGVFSELWSQGPEDTRWSVEEIRQFVQETIPSDPQLWPWLRRKTVEAIRDHRDGVKKN